MKGFREYPELKKLIKEVGVTIKEVGFKVGENYTNIVGHVTNNVRLSQDMKEEVVMFYKYLVVVLNLLLLIEKLMM